MPKVHLLDLTGAQIAQVEAAMELPVDEWRAAHKGKLYPVILSVALGGTVDEYAALPIRELLDTVVIEDDEGKDKSA